MDTVSSAQARFRPHPNSGKFADIVGQFDKEVVLQGGNQEPHARFDMNVNGQPYEADINVHSTENPDGSPGGSNVQYAIQDQVVDSMPDEGVQPGARFSYSDQGLTDSDFKTVSDDQLHQQLEQLAKASSRIELMGMTYHDPGKDGIHDIHMNRAGQDGAARYYIEEGGQIHQETVFIKFQNQHLPNSGGGSDRGVG